MGFIISLVTFSLLTVAAQTRVINTTVKMKEAKTLLGMNGKEFAKFKHHLALYNDSMKTVMNNPVLTREERIESVGRIQINRRNYLQTIMTDDKYKMYVEFEKTMKRKMPYKRG